MSCNVFLEGQFFKGGDIVQGKVVCTFTSKQEIRGIKVKLCGKEYTGWCNTEVHRDSATDRTETRRVHYHGDNTFLEQQITVCGAGNVHTGTREYPFSLSLPETLPDTYKNAHGHVEYYVKAKVDVPLAPDLTGRRDITVRSPLDLNRMPNICMDPVEYEDEKTLCCFCCASDPITMKVSLDKEAFVIGETPRLKVHIVNMSNESIESLEVQLTMTLVSKVTFPKTDTKSSEELIAAAHESGVGAHGERIYDIALDIPRTTFVPNFSLCSLFEQSTELSVEAILSGCHQDMEIKTDIVLGHIPMANTVFVNGCYQRAGAVYYPTTAVPPPGGPMGMPYPAGQTGGPPAMGFCVPNEKAPSAPPPEGEPSAPPKNGMASDDFELIDDDQGTAPNTPMLAPPPSYNDATRNDQMKK